MKFRKCILSILVFISILCITNVLASEGVSFSFSKVGNKAIDSNYLKSGKQVLQAYDFGKNDATLGLSLDVQSGSDWKFISRCNKSIADTTNVSCTWNQKWLLGGSKLFRGTLVLNSTGDNFDGNISGYMTLTN